MVEGLSYSKVILFFVAQSMCFVAAKVSLLQHTLAVVNCFTIDYGLFTFANLIKERNRRLHSSAPAISNSAGTSRHWQKFDEPRGLGLNQHALCRGTLLSPFWTPPLPVLLEDYKVLSLRARIASTISPPLDSSKTLHTEPAPGALCTV